MWLLVLQRIFLDFLLHIVYFPVWWFTVGAKQTLFSCFHKIQQVNTSLAPGLWLKNMFVPMYGQTDFQGRLLSILMRFVNTVFRSIALLFSIFFILLFFVIWLVFPLFVVWMGSASLLL
ncbi:MAG: hypothetical protein CL685_03475 [Candidatus Magasanikbacteria bacterium]|nr:hypothetical protein [Candidatus Magasanikbacteria bacterium]|tara:strand:+ start:308 stop:664 length:357 start_codon:yes stop_codon:yes gene_type:complete